MCEKEYYVHVCKYALKNLLNEDPSDPKVLEALIGCDETTYNEIMKDWLLPSPESQFESIRKDLIGQLGIPPYQLVDIPQNWLSSHSDQAEMFNRRVALLRDKIPCNGLLDDCVIKIDEIILSTIIRGNFVVVRRRRNFNITTGEWVTK